MASRNPKSTNGNDLLELQKLKNDEFGKVSGSNIGKNHKIHPSESTTVEGFFSRQESLEKKSSDLEFETYIGHRRQKHFSYRNEEKSQLICFKDNKKVITIKNDSKLTKYNTFDMKSADKNRLVKYKSLDIPSNAKTIVKYIEPQAKLSISAEDFRADYKLSRYDRKKHRHDIITDTVDAWAKKSGKNVFSNLKNSLFCNNTEKEIIYKPLIFGGTYPIDCPTSCSKTSKSVLERKTFDTKCYKKHNITQAVASKLREYGPPRTYDIDQPI